MGLTAVVPGCCPALIYFLTSYRQVLMKAYRLAGGRNGSMGEEKWRVPYFACIRCIYETTGVMNSLQHVILVDYLSDCC